MIREEIVKSLETCPIVKKGDYNYFVHPISDGLPLVEPKLLKGVAELIKENFNTDVDKIVCVEAMGIHLATALSLEIGVPFVVVRKRKYGLPGELAVHQTTGYSKGELYINAVEEGDDVLVLDDVASTGGTMVAVLEALNKKGINIKEIVTVIDKDEGNNIVEEKTGFKLNSLMKVTMIDGKVKAESLV